VMPEVVDLSDANVACRSFPSGETIPIPVITALLMIL